jgi:hypothetical protein
MAKRSLFIRLFWVCKNQFDGIAPSKEQCSRRSALVLGRQAKVQDLHLAYVATSCSIYYIHLLPVLYKTFLFVDPPFRAYSKKVLSLATSVHERRIGVSALTILQQTLKKVC